VTPTSGPGKENSSKVLSTPAVRHLAKKNNIDLSIVKATGKGGRVTKEDLINFLEKDSFVKEEPVA
jgi:pyruvate/2-oxoglutarate dehydrogenase complex dihydrolipoamide acyltransferase (E2) component